MPEKTQCPNCKKEADIITVDEVDYVNCPECGWFQVQADGSRIPCDPPASPIVPTPEPGQIEQPVTPGEGPAATPGDGKPLQEPALTPPSPGKPDPDDEDDGIKIRVKFED